MNWLKEWLFNRRKLRIPVYVDRRQSKLEKVVEEQKSAIETLNGVVASLRLSKK